MDTTKKPVNTLEWWPLHKASEKLGINGDELLNCAAQTEWINSKTTALGKELPIPTIFANLGDGKLPKDGKYPIWDVELIVLWELSDAPETVNRLLDNLICGNLEEERILRFGQFPYLQIDRHEKCAIHPHSIRQIIESRADMIPLHFVGVADANLLKSVQKCVQSHCDSIKNQVREKGFKAVCVFHLINGPAPLDKSFFLLNHQIVRKIGDMKKDSSNNTFLRKKSKSHPLDKILISIGGEEKKTLGDYLDAIDYDMRWKNRTHDKDHILLQRVGDGKDEEGSFLWFNGKGEKKCSKRYLANLISNLRVRGCVK